MRIRPGKNLLYITIVMTILSPVTFVWSAAAWVLLAAVVPLLIVAILDFLALKKQFGKIKIVRHLPTIIGRNLPFVSELELFNQDNSCAKGMLRDVFPDDAKPDYCPLPIEVDANGGSQLTAVDVQIPIRGLHKFGPVWLRLLGSYGMLEMQQCFDSEQTIKVLPETYASKDILKKDKEAQLLMLDKLSQAQMHGQGTEFESLSEFRQGDDPRRIDWRTTARLSYPIVRRYQIERHRDVVILVDCGRLMGAETSEGSKLDCAVDSTLMLAEVALQHGDRCGIGYFDDQVRGYHPPISGIKSIRTIAESIFNLQSNWRESDFGVMFAKLQQRQTRRSLIVLLSDIVDVDTSRRFRTSLARLAKRHVVLFAAIRTPLLEQVVQAKVSSLTDGARQAVTYRLLQHRLQALHTLQHSGVHIIDVEPRQLTVPLINQFIDLRCRNLL